eukprot:6192585-Pleurochrysis_carterae.AAC.3
MNRSRPMGFLATFEVPLRGFAQEGTAETLLQLVIRSGARLGSCDLVSQRGSTSMAHSEQRHQLGLRV